MNIKSLAIKNIKGLESCTFESFKDHSKWVIPERSSVPWTCIGDVNRAVSLLELFYDNSILNTSLKIFKNKKF